MASAQLSPTEQQISDFLSDILNLETIEVGFNCFLTHRPDIAKANEANSKAEFIKIISNIQGENAANAAANTDPMIVVGCGHFLNYNYTCVCTYNLVPVFPPVLLMSGTS